MDRPSTPHNIGKKIGSYVIDAQIGVGGMGEVYRARDTLLEREVAIKLLSPHHRLEDGRLRALFAEVRAAAALNHPHVVAVYDHGQLDPAEAAAVDGVIRQTRRAAPLGRVAKTSAGALTHVRLASVVNIARAVTEAIRLPIGWRTPREVTATMRPQPCCCIGGTAS